MLKTPDIQYSGYTETPEQETRCCINCKFYKPIDDKRGKCYEYEVLPHAGCELFKERE
jgi:hypothetical protein